MTEFGLRINAARPRSGPNIVAPGHRLMDRMNRVWSLQSVALLDTQKELIAMNAAVNKLMKQKEHREISSAGPIHGPP